MSTPPTTSPATQQVHTTPLSKGSGSRQSENASAGHSQLSYEPYLRHDIANAKQLSLDEFMDCILDRADWQHYAADKVENILNQPKFQSLLMDYPKTGGEKVYYHPFVALANYAVTKHQETGIALCRNDPIPVSGSYASRTPDVIIAHHKRIFFGDRISDDNCKRVGPKQCPFHWAELLSFVEFKLKQAPGMIDQPIFKWLIYASQKCNRQRGALPLHLVCTNHNVAHSDPTFSACSSGAGYKRLGSELVAESPTKTPRTSASVDEIHIQCASYALEMLSNGGMRTHVLGFLVRKDELYLLYFDRSIFIHSQPLQFIQRPAEFVAILKILDELSDQQWGFVPGFDPRAFDNNTGERLTRSKHVFLNEAFALSNGVRLKFEQILSRHHGLRSWNLRHPCIGHITPKGMDTVRRVENKLTGP
jgi:hypothetical protein